MRERVRRYRPKPCPCPYRCGQTGLCDRWKRELHAIMAGAGKRGYTIKGTRGQAWEREEDRDDS